jgi:hypothetical protein
VEVQLHTLTSALDGREWQTSRSDHFTPGIHWIESWVYPRTGLDAVAKRKQIPSLPLPGIVVQSAPTQLPQLLRYTNQKSFSIYTSGTGSPLIFQ